MKKVVSIIENKKIIFFIAFLLMFSTTFFIAKEASAKISYTIIVKIQGATKGDVKVGLTGGDLTTPQTKTTPATGIVKFLKLSNGNYTVTPTKDGYSFSPSSKDVSMKVKTRTYTVTFKAAQISATTTVTVDKSTVTVSEIGKKTVYVKVKDAEGKGIPKKIVTATSSDETIAKVAPLTIANKKVSASADAGTGDFDTSDSDGLAIFEISGVSAGKATITYSSDGKIATTEVTVTAGLEAEEWLESGHANTTATAFNDWNTPTPPATTPSIPTSCAKCHSRPGFLDYIGADGTAAGTVDNAAPIGTVIDCLVCHDDTAWKLTSVTFPSGKVVNNLGHEAICMTCHQGRESKVSVDTALTGKEEDTVAATISFKNIHYFAAGATQYGTQAQGGYEYDGKKYDGKFPHVTEADTCIECHDAMSLEVNLTLCKTCHTTVTSKDDLKNIRMASSSHDYDGDGNTTEGISGEIEGLQTALLSAIQSYASTISGTKIAYSASSYPYFFIDTNGNGVVDTDEAVSTNKYNAWTPRLLKAAYNYQFSIKDPGAFAHNAKYVIELLYDSLADLATKVTVDMSKMVRNDSGHFDATAEAFRHWDSTGTVDASCTRCHAPSEGFDYYIANFALPASGYPATYGFTCETCHTGAGFTTGNAPLKSVSKVIFPSGNTINNTTSDSSFICMTCHQGRESKVSVDAAITAWVDTNANGYSDSADTKPLSFKNVHYLPAGATLYGSDAGVGYEYSGKSYTGKWGHFDDSAIKCVYCHKPSESNHSFDPVFDAAVCGVCHTEVTDGDITKIRKGRSSDYDGDGSTTEKLSDEIAGLQADLLAQMQSVATALGKPIAYSAASYPYFFNDTNANGIVDTDEATSANAFKSWTPALLKASFNYQFSVKEPGAWAHNTKYMIQLLIDSIKDLGGTKTYSRPS